MSTTPTAAPAARDLAQLRWTKPENVDRRIAALAAHVRRVVDSLPPLSAEQAAEAGRIAAHLDARIAALTPPADGSAA